MDLFLRGGSCSPTDYAAMVAGVSAQWNVGLTIEPEVSHADLLMTPVIWLKLGVATPFVIVDATMNDLGWAAMYGAYHRFAAAQPSSEKMVANLAGLVCEVGAISSADQQIDHVARGELALSCNRYLRPFADLELHSPPAKPSNLR